MIPDDYNHEVNIILREVQTCTLRVPEPIVEFKTAGDLAHTVPAVNSVDRCVDLGESVLVRDQCGDQINMDPEAKVNQENGERNEKRKQK